jgi:hypothetical protein
MVRDASLRDAPHHEGGVGNQEQNQFVIAGHSRQRQRRFATPYDPAIHRASKLSFKRLLDARVKPGHDEQNTFFLILRSA